MAPTRGHVFGTLQVDPAPHARGEGAFRFSPDITRPHTLATQDCVEAVLFNHDPDRLVATLASCGNFGRWTPGARLFQIERGDFWPTFDMSAEPVSPCPPGRSEA